MVDQQAGPAIGLDMGTFAVKGVLVEGSEIRRVSEPTSGRSVEAARRCLASLLDERHWDMDLRMGVTGTNAHLIARELNVTPTLDIEAICDGMAWSSLAGDAVLSLGHENIYYLEVGSDYRIEFFNRNGQCAAGSGAFWYQQATRLGYDDEALAKLAVEAEDPIRISGRCAVFAKSDMTHAINEGATQGAVSAGLARTLAEMVVINVTQNRILERDRVFVVGGVANNQAVLKYLRQYCEPHSVTLDVPEHHEYLSALGAAQSDERVRLSSIDFDVVLDREYVPDNPLPALAPDRVSYQLPLMRPEAIDTSRVYLGVDCGSVSTKCVLLDRTGNYLGGVYLPTSGRPALQVLELMREVHRQYGDLLEDADIVACTTGSGRFLSQKMLSAEYAVDEITCQAEGIKYLYGEDDTLSVIEIGGEDSKFFQIRDGALYDYNMNPVCAAGTGTFLENLAGLLGVDIKGEFSDYAFAAPYAIDLGDTCTLLSQSTLASHAAQGLPFSAQIASLAYSSARNYITKTAENRQMEGRVVFTGATAKNHALASAFSGELGKDISVPPNPELTGALGSALMALNFDELGISGDYRFRNLDQLNTFEQEQRKCQAECEYEHNCTLDVIRFSDGSTFLYGDRCGRYSELEKKRSAQYEDLPDFVAERNEIFYRAAGEPLEGGVTVGIARSGPFFDLYPFWAHFFRELGAEVALSKPTTEATLQAGKKYLDAEMCYPVEVILGHYAELAQGDAEFIFVPDLVTMEPLPWTTDWPRSFGCPLLQTMWGMVKNSLDLEDERILYAQLNFREGRKMVTNQLRTVARRLLGTSYKEWRLREAITAGYQAQRAFQDGIERASERLMDTLPDYMRADTIAGVFLGRPYTTFDHEVSKGSLEFARQRGVLAIPQEYLLAYVRGWYEGRIPSDFMGSREDFEKDFNQLLTYADNIYPAQLQRMLAAAHIVQYLNKREEEHGLPRLYTILQDPFKCGPNAMLRHFLRHVSQSLRLTMDEHTAPAGMITRLEAFRNTCLSRKTYSPPTLLSAETLPANQLRQRKVLIPEPSAHGQVFAAMLENQGVEAEVLPRSSDSDLGLAKRYVNGEECLPLIQNMQDFLSYAEEHPDDLERVVFFQGWACGPCRYGLYAPTQSVLLNRAGLGERRIFAGQVGDMVKEFGLGFAVGLYDGSVSVDILSQLLHATRPYERHAGASQAVFDKYVAGLMEMLKRYRFKTLDILLGRHLRPFEILIEKATKEFAAIPKTSERRPRIAVAGEWYVRLDDRSNQAIIRKIEAAGGEASLSPASEIFSYTALINYVESRTLFRQSGQVGAFFRQLGFAQANKLVARDEHRLASAADALLAEDHEPTPLEIRAESRPYISAHYGGEPPMTIGRVAALAKANRIEGAVLVAPFTCMPGSVVESQLTVLRRDLDIPMVATYYDGTENPSREELIQGLVYQAKQRLSFPQKLVADNDD